MYIGAKVEKAIGPMLYIHLLVLWLDEYQI